MKQVKMNVEKILEKENNLSYEKNAKSYKNHKSNKP